MKVFIEFSGVQGSGKSTLSRYIRKKLGDVGFKVEDIATQFNGDTLRIETTRESIRSLAKRMDDL